jgi:hypothetical protein
LYRPGEQGSMPTMNAARRELFEGLGLSALALLLTGMLLYAAVVAMGHANYLRAAAFGVPGLITLYWSIRFTRAQFAAYRAWTEDERRGP